MSAVHVWSFGSAQILSMAGREVMTPLEPIIGNALPIDHAGAQITATRISRGCSVVGLAGGEGKAVKESARRVVISVNDTT